MGKIKFSQPEKFEENFQLTFNKLPTIGVMGTDKQRQVHICMTADRKLQTIDIDPALVLRGDTNEIRRTFEEALKMALEGVRMTRESEFEGRLADIPDRHRWNDLKAYVI